MDQQVQQKEINELIILALEVALQVQFGGLLQQLLGFEDNSCGVESLFKVSAIAQKLAELAAEVAHFVYFH